LSAACFEEFGERGAKRTSRVIHGSQRRLEVDRDDEKRGEEGAMKTIQVEIPERIAAEIAELVRAGWFASEGEAVRAAVLDFVRRNRGELLDRFLRQDIEWALRQKEPRA